MPKSRKKKPIGYVIIACLIAMLIASIAYFIVIISNNQVEINFGLSLFFAVLLIVSIVFLVIIYSSYNKLVRFYYKIEESLALIDIQLKLRFDLIPNLVSTVKAYAKHEKEVFSEISKLRNLATKTDDEKEKLEYANKIVPKMRQIIVIAEKYPELKADALFKSLMEELVLVEDKIVAARRFYDSNVNIYNTTIEVWPTNAIAKIYGFEKQELFKIDAGEKFNINIDFKEGN